MNYLPECETIYVQGKRMRQVFSNGNILVVELETDRYRLYSAGEEVEGKERMSGVLDTIPSLMQVQCIAEDYNLLVAMEWYANEWCVTLEELTRDDCTECDPHRPYGRTV